MLSVLPASRPRSSRQIGSGIASIAAHVLAVALVVSCTTSTPAGVPSGTTDLRAELQLRPADLTSTATAPRGGMHARDLPSGCGIVAGPYVEPRLEPPMLADNSGSALQYPAQFREARIEGRVTGDFVVDSAGYADAETFRVLSGHDAVFEQEVRRALRRVRYQPAVASGHPVPHVVRQTFIFSLSR